MAQPRSVRIAGRRSFVISTEYRDITSEGMLRAASFKNLSKAK
jgi:hypothetical protein